VEFVDTIIFPQSMGQSVEYFHSPEAHCVAGTRCPMTVSIRQTPLNQGRHTETITTLTISQLHVSERVISEMVLFVSLAGRCLALDWRCRTPENTMNKSHQ
jgi:hypothetical protein